MVNKPRVRLDSRLAPVCCLLGDKPICLRCPRLLLPLKTAGTNAAIAAHGQGRQGPRAEDRGEGRDETATVW